MSRHLLRREKQRACSGEEAEGLRPQTGRQELRKERKVDLALAVPLISSLSHSASKVRVDELSDADVKGIAVTLLLCKEERSLLVEVVMRHEAEDCYGLEDCTALEELHQLLPNLYRQCRLKKAYQRSTYRYRP